MDKKEFWNERASLGNLAGTNDFIAKKLEMDSIAKYIDRKDEEISILDFGCGNAVTILHLASLCPKAKILGIDFSENMIEDAQKKIQEHNLQDRISFMVGTQDILNNLNEKFDYIYTERCLINLDSWQEQKNTIYNLTKLLKDNGIYIMCESSLDGLNKINEYRQIFSLPVIKYPWHNIYFENKNIEEMLKEDKVSLITLDHFSSTYYFVSRVLNAKLAYDQGEEPKYDSPLNKIAIDLPSINDVGQGKIWVFKQK